MTTEQLSGGADNSPRSIGGLVVAGLAALPAIGAAMVCAIVPNGGIVALGLFWGGVSLAGVLWWSTRSYGGSWLDQLARLSFAGCGGLAAYAMASWCVWRAGLPIDLGIIRDGRMGEHWWLGPATAGWSALSYANLRWNSWGGGSTSTR